MLLEFKDLKKHYRASSGFFRQSAKVVKAVDGVSLKITAGEHLGLVGESGCGKTTLGRLAVKLLLPDQGAVIFDGHDLSSVSSQRVRQLRKNIQMVFQDPFSSLDPRFRVEDILREAMLYDRQTTAQKQERIRQALLAVCLKENILHRYAYEFSGGERQRIAIARALIMQPRLLILDEAVSSLDVLVQEEILNLLLDLQKKFNVTYFFISHNLRVVRRVCHRIAVMFEGRIVELGSRQDIFDNPLHPYTRQLLAAATAYEAPLDQVQITHSKDAKLVERAGGHYVISD